MATPSSSATSPSPALSFAAPATVSELSTDDPTDRAERDERRSRFLKRAEFAKMTRALRSTLALASYKAKHNVMNVPLRSLEAQVAHIKPQMPIGIPSVDLLNASSSFSSNDKKRKAGGSAGASQYGASGQQHQTSSPYASASGYNNIAGPSSLSANTHQQHTNAAHSLFASILAPPPSKRARTIHNPEAPPVPPAKPYKPKEHKVSPVNKKGKTASSKATKKEDQPSKSRSKPSAGRKRAGSHESSQTTRSAFSGEDVNDTDIKAAATLTEIFLSHGAGSPRSSFHPGVPLMNSSQGQSLPSSQSRHAGGLSHSQRSSTSSFHVTSPTLAPGQTQNSQGRTHSRNQSTGSVTGAGIFSGAVGARGQGISGGGSLDANMDSSSVSLAASKPRASDSEAADLMLHLANSPSPRRPTVVRDKETARNVYAAGRVLFPTASQSSTSSTRSEEYGEASREGRVLARTFGSAGSFSSVFGSERTLVGEAEKTTSAASKGLSPLPTQIIESPPPEPVVTPPTPKGPSISSSTVQPSGLPLAPPFPTKSANGSTLTPSQSFSLSDYIHIPPSPVAHVSATNALTGVPPSGQVQPGSGAQAAGAGRHKPSLSASSMTSAGLVGLRHQAVVSSPLRRSFDSSSVGMPPSASSSFGGVGRRLFEGDASNVMEGAIAGQGGTGGSVARHPTPLGSGIDLQL